MKFFRLNKANTKEFKIKMFNEKLDNIKDYAFQYFNRNQFKVGVALDSMKLAFNPNNPYFEEDTNLIYDKLLQEFGYDLYS